MKKYAVLFPGQGSQYIGMGKKLYKEYSIVKQLYDTANDILKFNIRDMCFSGDMTVLTNTSNAQPAILLAGVAAYRVFCENVEVEPVYMAGHSIGELTALTCAGAMNFEDALKIVRRRGELMENANPDTEGTMAAILNCEVDRIQQVCDELSVCEDYVCIANYNSAAQIVISGKKSTVGRAVERLNESGAKTVMLNVSGAFHSELMKPIVKKFQNTLKKYQFNSFKIPVIANVNALPYESSSQIYTNLAQQIVSPVQWSKTMEYLKDHEADCVIDMGPGNIVCNMAKRSESGFEAFSFEKEEELIWKYFHTPHDNIGKTSEYDHTVVTKCIAISVCTRNNSTTSSGYEEGAIKPYLRMQEMQKVIESEKRKPTDMECKEAIELLKRIFETKKTPEEERKLRYEEISKVTDGVKYIL